MENLDPETTVDAFVWEAPDVVEAEAADAAPAFEVMGLRSAALEALDTALETAPVTADQAEDVSIAALNIEVESADTQAAPEILPEVVEDSAVVETSDAVDTVPVADAGISDSDYVAQCMALLHETFPDGIDGLFSVDAAAALFGMVQGKGLVSGGEEWTDADNMLMDAVLISLQEDGYDLLQMWKDFAGNLAEKLFPDGYTEETLQAVLSQNGPISGEAGWTEIDFQAFDLATTHLLSEQSYGDWQDGSLEVFNEAYPDGILELFPDGYSDAALDALLEGHGLYSGEAEWTDADCIVFEGLLQALQESGIEPYASDGEFETMPIVVDDGFAYPMPIVMDDGEWMACEAEQPIMVVCDLMPPPEMVVCFPHEDMIAI